MDGDDVIRPLLLKKNLLSVNSIDVSIIVSIKKI